MGLFFLFGLESIREIYRPYYEIEDTGSNPVR